MQGFQDHIQKPQGSNEFVSRVDREVSTDSMHAEQKDVNRMSSPWSLQDLHSMDGPTRSGAPIINSDQSDGYAARLSGLSKSGSSSLARMAGRPQIASSQIGGSSFGFLTNAVSGSIGAASQHRFASLGAGSPSRQSAMSQRSPSPTLTMHHSHLTEQDHAKTQSLTRPDPRVSHYSGKFNAGLHNQYSKESLPIQPPNARPGSKAKIQSQEIQASSLSTPTFQPRRHHPIPQQLEEMESDDLDQTQKLPLTQTSNFGSYSVTGNSAPEAASAIPVETTGPSSTSSLLAAVMNSGILSNNPSSSSAPNLSFQDLGELSSSASPPTQLASSVSEVASASSLDLPSHDKSPPQTKTSQKNVGQPPLLSGLPPSSSFMDDESENASDVVNNVTNPISNLLSTLVAKGLISASKTESSNVQVPTELQKKSSINMKTSSVLVTVVSDSPASSIKDTSFSEPTTKSNISLPQSVNSDIENLIGYEFKADVLREFHPSVVSELFDDFAHRCSVCGLQLKLQERLSRHLEWHDLKKPEANDSIKASRRWYCKSTDWVAGKVGLPLVIESAKSLGKPCNMVDEGEPMVPADESQCACVLCGEIFEDFYCQERDDWMLRGATHMIFPSGAGEVGSKDDSAAKGPIVHATCISETSLHDLGLVNVKRVRLFFS